MIMTDANAELWKRYEFLNNQLGYLHGIIALADAKAFGLVTLSGALLGWLTLQASSGVFVAEEERGILYWCLAAGWVVAMLAASVSGFCCLFGTIRPRHRWHRRMLSDLRLTPPDKGVKGFVSGPAVRAWGSDDKGFADGVASASVEQLVRELAFLYKKNYEISRLKYDYQLVAVWSFGICCIFVLVVAVISATG